MRDTAMETSLQKRVRSRMDMLQMNPFQTAKKAELGDSFVRDILRGKTRSPNAENLAKLAVALETTSDWLMGADDSQPSATLPPIGGLEVVGAIQAGSWVDRSILDDSPEREIIPVARDPRFLDCRQYALLVVGDSMNLEFPEGSYVTCVDFADSGMQLKVGRMVHVERQNGPLVEATLKVIDRVDGVIMLCPKSSNPKHLPIKLDGDSGTEIVVRGVVTGSYRRTEI